MSKLSIVTQTFPPRTGGMESVMFALANGLAQRNWKIHVIAEKAFDRPVNFLHTAIRAPKFLRSHIKRLFLQFVSKPNLYLCDSWKSVEAVPSDGIPIVVLAHGQEFLDGKKFERIKSSLNRAAVIVASSFATIDLISKVSDEFRTKCVCIYPTYGLSRADTPIRDNYEGARTLQILSLSRIERRKGLFESADALARLASQGHQFTWVIAGAGPDLEALKEYCRDMPFVRFSGRVSESEKNELFRKSNLFLMPSFRNGFSLEGFGITYIESAKYGLASIGGIDGGAAEAVLDRVTGWSVDGRDSSAIEIALSEAINFPDKLLEYGSNAQERFTNDLCAEVALSKINSVLSQVMQTEGKSWL